VAGSGTSWTATKSVVASDPEGMASLLIACANIAGVSAIDVTATTSGNVRVDLTPPTLPAVSVSSTPLSIGPLDIITLRFNASEALQAPLAVSIESHTVAAMCDAALACVATYTVDATVDTEGGVSFSIGFSDLAGNAGAAVSAVTDGSSVTIDLSAPTLTVVSMTSNNGGDTSLAKAGDTITVSITSSEAIAAPSVTVAGGVATVAGSGTSWSATLPVVSGTPEGTASLLILYADVVGNAGTNITATSGSIVTVDVTPPSITGVSVASNAVDPSVAVEGSVLTVTLNVSEPIAAPSVTIAGLTAIVSCTASQCTATATVTAGAVAAGVVANGAVSFSIGSIADLAGNQGSGTSSVTDGSSVTVNLDALTMTTAQLRSSNSASVYRAVVSDIVTLSLTASKQIQSPVVTFSVNGVTVVAGRVAVAAVGVGGASYTARFTVVTRTAR
jgi:hypothetical protein